MNHEAPISASSFVGLRVALLFLVSLPGSAGEQSFLPDMQRFANPSGAAATFSTAGKG